MTPLNERPWIKTLAQVPDVNHSHTNMKTINEVRCFETKIEESEKADSHQESNPGHLWLEPSVLCH